MKPTSKKSLIKLLNIEKKRTDLAIKGKNTSFLATYKLNQIRNDNSSSFWDSKFLEDNYGANFIENDRNATAKDWLIKLVSSGNKVLNVGCGDGEFEKLLYSLPQDVQYVGLDYAKESISRLKKIFPLFKFIVGDILKVKIKKNYDVICIFEVMEHISWNSTFKLLKKLNDSLKSNGYLLVAVPLNEPLLEMYPSNPNAHVRAYSKETICKELELSGFSIVTTKEFIAFSTLYKLKSLLAKYIMVDRWKPNDILILAQKK